jgi:UDP-glucose 4-epimerase
MTAPIFVTGGAGFLGNYLIRELAAQKIPVVGLDRLARPSELVCEWVECLLPSSQSEEALRTLTPSVLIHLAGTASVQNSFANPLNDFQQNVTVFMHLLEGVRKYVPQCRVLVVSSAAVYGNPKIIPTSESSDTQPLSPYGYHKLLCELLGQEYHQAYGIKFAVARVFSAYGEGLRKQVLWDICKKILQNESVELSGTGTETRDFIHAIDIAKGLRTLVQQARFDGDIYNLANGEQIEIRALAEMLNQALHRSAQIKFSGANRQGDPLKWQADINAIRALGFVPSIKFADGIQNYARWVQAQ